MVENLRESNRERDNFVTPEEKGLIKKMSLDKSLDTSMRQDFLKFCEGRGVVEKLNLLKPLVMKGDKIGFINVMKANENVGNNLYKKEGQKLQDINGISWEDRGLITSYILNSLVLQGKTQYVAEEAMLFNPDNKLFNAMKEYFGLTTAPVRGKIDDVIQLASKLQMSNQNTEAITLLKKEISDLTTLHGKSFEGAGHFIDELVARTADSYLGNGDKDGAMKFIAPYAKEYPNNYAINVKYAKLLTQKGDYAAAKKIFDTLLQTQSQSDKYNIIVLYPYFESVIKANHPETQNMNIQYNGNYIIYNNNKYGFNYKTMSLSLNPTKSNNLVEIENHQKLQPKKKFPDYKSVIQAVYEKESQLA